LTITGRAALEIAPPQRLTTERVRRYAQHLRQTNAPRSVAIQIEMLYGVARAMMPDLDLHWLRVMRARLRSAAPRGGAVIL
jgi:hypothetical protein